MYAGLDPMSEIKVPGFFSINGSHEFVVPVTYAQNLGGVEIMRALGLSPTL